MKKLMMLASVAAVGMVAGCFTSATAYTEKTNPDGTKTVSRVSVIGTGDKASQVAAEGLFADGAADDLGAGVKTASANQKSTGIDGTLQGVGDLLRPAGNVAVSATVNRTLAGARYDLRIPVKLGRMLDQRRNQQRTVLHQSHGHGVSSSGWLGFGETESFRQDARPGCAPANDATHHIQSPVTWAPRNGGIPGAQWRTGSFESGWHALTPSAALRESSFCLPHAGYRRCGDSFRSEAIATVNLPRSQILAWS